MQAFNAYFEDTYQKDARDLYEVSKWFNQYEACIHTKYGDFKHCLDETKSAFPSTDPFRAVLNGTIELFPPESTVHLAKKLLDQAILALVKRGVFRSEKAGLAVFNAPMHYGHIDRPLLEKIFEELAVQALQQQQKSSALAD